MLCLTLTLAKNISDSQASDIVGQLVESLNWHPETTGGEGVGFKAINGRQVQGQLGSADETVGFILSAARSATWGVHLAVISNAHSQRAQNTAANHNLLELAASVGKQALRAPGGVKVVRSNGQKFVDSTVAPELGPVEAALQLLCSIERRRSDEGQAAGLMINAGKSQSQAARTLGVSQQAVSARLQAGYWYESRKVAYWLAVQLDHILASE
ncbi:MAG TPA: hypothetical protein VIG71_08575 [Enteractinococcus sp.]